jgi:hypothetical protein
LGGLSQFIIKFFIHPVLRVCKEKLRLVSYRTKKGGRNRDKQAERYVYAIADSDDDDFLIRQYLDPETPDLVPKHARQEERSRRRHGRLFELAKDDGKDEDDEDGDDGDGYGAIRCHSVGRKES